MAHQSNSASGADADAFQSFVASDFRLAFAQFVYRVTSLKVKFTIVISIIFAVPGDGGSQVDAKLNKPSTVHYICDKTTKDWFNLWLNLELLAPLIIDCWTDNAKLRYDNVTRKTSNAPGVEIRIPGWGTPDVVEYIDPSQAKQGAYFKEIGNALVRSGYVRNVSMRGAPYDFRKGPSKFQNFICKFFDKLLKNLF